MDLAAHQRKLLGLFRSTYRAGPGDDAYIRNVARSKDLREGRRNIFLWRVWVLKRTCPLTFNLLKQRGLLEETLGAFISGHNISPFRETQAPAFLDLLGGHPDRLIECVARFERALMKVREGEAGPYVVRWPIEPGGVLHALAKDRPVPNDLPEGAWETVISADIPGQFEIVFIGG